MVWLLPLLGITVMAGWFIILFQAYHIPFNDAIYDSIISVLILALCSWGLIKSINIYPTRTGALLYSLLMAIVFSVAAVSFTNLALPWAIKGADKDYLAFVSYSMPARYILTWLMFSWVATYFSLNQNISTREAQFKQQADTAALLKEAELFKLRQQLQPHFLYNSLNSISALTITNPDKAQQMVGRLSDFLRTSVKREGKENVPLQEELEYLNNYLEIEATRFGDRLEVIFNNSADNSATMPPFLLQPILENAIKFGLYGNTGKVKIEIDINSSQEMLQVVITNPYNKDTSAPRGTGFGIKGIQRRLYLLYARNDLLELIKKDNYFITIIKIPQSHV